MALKSSDLPGFAFRSNATGPDFVDREDVGLAETLQIPASGVRVMLNPAAAPPLSQLSYLDASKVTSPAGVLSELDILSVNGERMGNITGVVIEAAARRVRYYDVTVSGQFRHRRCLVAADHLAHLDESGKALRLRADSDLEDVADLDAMTLRQFSDDDLLTALFASRAA